MEAERKGERDRERTGGGKEEAGANMLVFGLQISLRGINDFIGFGG